MNKQLSEAITKLGKLPEDRQEQAALLLFDFIEQEGTGIELTPEQIAEIRRREDEDDIATDEEVKAFFARFEK
jgi:hypothetical protein